MVDIAETLFKFKLVQLEGKLAIYESLLNEVAQLEHINAVVSNVKSQLEDVFKEWNTCNLEGKHVQ